MISSWSPFALLVLILFSFLILFARLLFIALILILFPTFVSHDVAPFNLLSVTEYRILLIDSTTLHELAPARTARGVKANYDWSKLKAC
jgi:hypothetical protein